MLNIFSKLFDNNEKQIDRLQFIVKEINGFEHKYENMSSEDIRFTFNNFRTTTQELVKKINDSEKTSTQTVDRKNLSREELELSRHLKNILPEVFAIIREISKRKFNRRHYDVQLMAGIVLAEGKISEVKTGEGKTQIAWLPLALYALTGRGAHLVTVNDYLAKAHGEYSGHIFAELGLTVGIIEPRASYVFISDDKLEEEKGTGVFANRMKVSIQNPGDVNGLNLKSVTKKESYACDILYATNSELGFDYLRDNMATNIKDLVQNELYFGIVDEVDSILIDEARTPLIMATSKKKPTDNYKKFANIVGELVDDDFTVDEKSNSVSITDKGAVKVEGILGVKNLWEDYQLAHHLDNALKARVLFKKDDEYIVQNGEIMIVDQFTGRVLPGRRFSEGLHQAIEAKEKVEIKQESATMATITYQNLFRTYKHLSGMTGTAVTEAEEFYKIYGLDVISVPTNKPVIRKDLTDVVYKNQEAKFKAVTEDIIEKYNKEQPVLVGTTSVEKSEYLSNMLRIRGVQHEVLNAKNHEREAHIVSLAGQAKSVTIATNMAGRGTDIKLGEGVADLGGLYVIGTERHESRRIDNQLRGRSGRQGDQGLSRFYLALDDEIMRIQGGMIVQKLMMAANIPDNMPIESRLIGNTIQSAQKKVEGSNFDIRKTVVEYDDVMNKQREIFYTRRRKLLKNISDAELSNTTEPTEFIQVNREELKLKLLDIIKRYLTDSELANIEVLINRIYSLADDSVVDSVINSILKGSSDSTARESLTAKLQATDIKDRLKILDELVTKLFDSKYSEQGIKFWDNGSKLALQTMDELWMEHLESMVDLRNSIRFSGYAQRDPLIEFKNKAFDEFERFMLQIDSGLAERIFKVQEVKVEQMDLGDLIKSLEDMGVNSQANLTNNNTQVKPIFKETLKNEGKVIDPMFANVGRNDPCPCGSGKKFKKCHGKDSK